MKNIKTDISNRPDINDTQKYIVSRYVRQQTTGGIVTTNANKKINAFGRWEGAPGGSGSRLTNY